jgi:hypothetical protein
VRQLIDADDEEPFDFIVSVLLLYRGEQRDTLELIRKSIYEGDSLTQMRAKVTFGDTRFLLHKMRGSNMNLGNELVTEKCAQLRQICVDEDLEALANGPGNFDDLVEACRVSATYFDRLLDFIKINMPECFDSAEE